MKKFLKQVSMDMCVPVGMCWNPPPLCSSRFKVTLVQNHVLATLTYNHSNCFWGQVIPVFREKFSDLPQISEPASREQTCPCRLPLNHLLIVRIKYLKRLFRNLTSRTFSVIFAANEVELHTRENVQSIFVNCIISSPLKYILFLSRRTLREWSQHSS